MLSSNSSSRRGVLVTYIDLVNRYAESDSENSDDSYEPPSNESHDESMSVVSAEDDPSYRVHVPKTAAQILEEYDSKDSDDSWTPS